MANEAIAFFDKSFDMDCKMRESQLKNISEKEVGKL